MFSILQNLYLLVKCWIDLIGPYIPTSKQSLEDTKTQIFRFIIILFPELHSSLDSKLFCSPGQPSNWTHLLELTSKKYRNDKPEHSPFSGGIRHLKWKINCILNYNFSMSLNHIIKLIIVKSVIQYMEII